ncbi:hypothetical protein DXC00_09765 [Ruminococcus sp. OM07-17]|nr:hypothetical protein DXC00_09765 [Ruminococcus sp. OM07-17]
MQVHGIQIIKGKGDKERTKKQAGDQRSHQYVAKVLNQRANAVHPYKKIIAAGDTMIPHSSFLIYLPLLHFLPKCAIMTSTDFILWR